MKDVKTVYFIGIGGIGISAIARMLALEGKKVYGSDRDASKVTDELQNAGITVFIGHKRENIESVEAKIDLFVYTAAIPEDNVEMVAATHIATSMGIPLLSYPQMLGEVSRTKYTIAVSGTHGKTTTTAMVAKIMIDAGLDPTVIVGSLITGPSGESTNFIAGKSKYFVVEADEYRKSFHNLEPSILVVNNLDEDHLDFYKDLADIQESFSFLVKKIPQDGVLITDSHNTHVLPLIKVAEEKKIQVCDYSQKKLTATLKIPGEHNRSNGKAALAVAEFLKIDPEKAQKSLEGFGGVWRRFEYKGVTGSGAQVYDDYAHNPQKVQALLAGARELFGKKQRIVAVFQPHLFSRTKTLFDSFLESFNEADVLILLPIFPAREVFDSTISSEMLRDALLKKGMKEVYSFDFKETEEFLEKNLKGSDVLITIGAGEAYKIADSLVIS